MTRPSGAFTLLRSSRVCRASNHATIRSKVPVAWSNVAVASSHAPRSRAMRAATR
jgi:hypothetical protein